MLDMELRVLDKISHEVSDSNPFAKGNKSTA